MTVESLNLKDIVQIIREEFSTQLSIRRIAWSESEFLTEIKADRLSVLRLIRNLVDNAIKYGDDLTVIQAEGSGSGLHREKGQPSVFK